jgi:hypothetical protein
VLYKFLPELDLLRKKLRAEYPSDNLRLSPEVNSFNLRKKGLHPNTQDSLKRKTFNEEN